MTSAASSLAVERIEPNRPEFFYRLGVYFWSHDMAMMFLGMYTIRYKQLIAGSQLGCILLVT